MELSFLRWFLKFQQKTHLPREPLIGKWPSLSNVLVEVVSALIRFADGGTLTRQASLTGAGKAYLWARVVRPNEFISQGESEVLDGDLMWVCVCHRHEMSEQDESIYHCTVEYKPKNVSVELSCLASNLVVVAKLVGMIHSTHKLVILHNIWGTWNRG